jgi:Holliday junction resolvase RusA-like endonuclease
MSALTILGRPRPKKNSPRIARTPTGRPFILPSQANQVWHRDAVAQLRAQWRGAKGPLPALTGPVSVTYRFLLPDRRSEPDADNLMAAVNDALQAAGVLANDRQIRCGTFSKSFGGDAPRVELVIHAVTEEAAA